MIKAILFDFDGVLTTDKTGSQSILRYLSAQCNIPYDILKPEYYKYNRQLLYHGLEHKDMWKEFCINIGRRIEYSVLIDSFRNTPLDMNMIDLAKMLKTDYLIGMITDNKCDRMDEIINHYHLSNLFDVVSVSAAYRSGKDDEAIFEGTIASLNVMAEECVFIDNSARNLSVPRKMGMRTILFDDEARDIDALKAELMSIL